MSDYPPWVWNTPEHAGFRATRKYYSAAEGPIDPTKVKLPSPFVVVVVGGSKGIGAGIAKAYAQAGASAIVVTSRKAADLHAVAAELARVQPETKVVQHAVDVTSEAQVRELSAMVESTFGRLDVLVANAGVAPGLIPDDTLPVNEVQSNGTKRKAYRFRPTVAAENVADFTRVVNTNFVGSLIVATSFLPLLQKTRDGPQTLIFSSSGSSLDTSSQLAPASYNISKMAVNRLAEHIHEDHFEKDGVVAIALHPGCIQTPISVDYPPLWDNILTDDISLPGGVCVWLTAEKRGWLSGRYYCANWDVDELLSRKNEIVERDLFKMRLVL
ncbi:hypothetical protein A1O1_06572 [Capronia coronata CBS 617.96]|uniref:Uncharacterized protein n=1 Tax=Capronia coronata CBS 617.96 TaxID=1182541 RepID=W9Y054_9EURO|nr:uncharacterized protein A1O1_06572 [Capronia coronata CBS 617.96]EXJ86202.1 hypothetical protein A1O1_06572 [Capronia coronata CBS 617.96]